MPVQVETSFYTVELLRANPNKIYVFGDNAQRYGKKGQSVIRDEPNAFGVANKLRPHGSMDSYFSDNDDKHWQIIHDDLSKLKTLQEQGCTIVFPAGGLGTGLSRMPELCPRLFDKLNQFLLVEFGFDNIKGVLVLPKTAEQVFAEWIAPFVDNQSEKANTKEENQLSLFS